MNDHPKSSYRACGQNSKGCPIFFFQSPTVLLVLAPVIGTFQGGNFNKLNSLVFFLIYL